MSAWLKNGNPPADLACVPRCGAKKRRKDATCQQPAMRNGKCRLHGGLSTGARTREGIERIRQARTKHGRYSAAAIAQRREARESRKAKRLQQQQTRREFREFMAVVRAAWGR
jgi:hypothetical protein